MTQVKAPGAPAYPKRGPSKNPVRGSVPGTRAPGISPEVLSALRAAVADSTPADSFQQVRERNARRFRGLWEQAGGRHPGK